MGLRFTNLASGSGGNASLIETDGFGVLLDAGLGPRQLATRLAAVGLTWSCVNAVVLTHTHSDHWNDRTLAYLLRRRVPFYCHVDHHRILEAYSPAFAGLRTANLLRSFEGGATITLAPGLKCRPIPIRHDSGATFAFRFEGPANLFGDAVALAYAADLGTWDDVLADALANVDLLAIEFNHDETMERGSGRAPRLIARVLGDEGHLSNDQAAALLHAVLARSTSRTLRHVVQLHLSRQCNRPALAQVAAEAILRRTDTQATVHTAEQDAPTETLALGDPVLRSRRTSARTRRASRVATGQLLLPGFES